LFAVGYAWLSFYIGWAVQVPMYKELNSTVADDFMLIFTRVDYALLSLLYGALILGGCIFGLSLILGCCVFTCLLQWLRTNDNNDKELKIPLFNQRNQNNIIVV
jgi:hypothetical protein